ncbi:MAG: FG-GAP repeat protein [Chloroflexi bacterium]|nr:FG-GAP repeat protein [Chloroflexota bacterium]
MMSIPRTATVVLQGLVLGCTVLAPPAHGQVLEDARLLVDDTEFQDMFGRSVAVAGAWAAVGEPNDDGAGANSRGAVHMFRRTAGGWDLVQELRPSEADPAGQFGMSVAMSGDHLVVGTPNSDFEGIRSRRPSRVAD